jgi:hypothetical protein
MPVTERYLLPSEYIPEPLPKFLLIGFERQVLDDYHRFLTSLALLLPGLGRFLDLHFLSSASELN